MGSRLLDLVVMYRLFKLLSTPFKDTIPYKMGIIDDDGNRIKPKLDSADKKEYTRLFIVASNLKKFTSRIPKLATYAGLLKLLREDTKDSKYIKEQLSSLTENYQSIIEDIAINNSGLNQTTTLNEPFSGTKVKKREIYGTEIYEVSHKKFKMIDRIKDPAKKWEKFLSDPDIQITAEDVGSMNIVIQSEETSEVSIIKLGFNQ